jgi:nicotinamidase-related amidase
MKTSLPALSIDPATTALVLIDLQKGIVARSTAPHSSAEVVATAARLADAFRQRGGLVVLIHVQFRDPKERVSVTVDQPMPAAAPPAPDWSDVVPEIGPRPGDIVVVKRQWGAFYGTELELQLRRRGIKTIVLGGIATNMGVESTARNANERGFDQIFVEDAMASFSAEMHRFAIENIFPRIGRVRTAEEVVGALGPAKIA